MLNDYESSILYHLGKANAVVDALRRFTMVSTAHPKEKKKELLKDVHRLSGLEVRLMNSTKGRIVVMNGVESSLVSELTKSNINIEFFLN